MWGTNHASRWICLLNHASRRFFFSPITRHVKRSKYIANFTFSTLKVSLKEKLCRFSQKNAAANMWSLARKRVLRYPFEGLNARQVNLPANKLPARAAKKKSGGDRKKTIRQAKWAVKGELRIALPLVTIPPSALPARPRPHLASSH